MSHNGSESCSSSSVGLPPLHLSNHYVHQKHSEEWVLPRHWKMDLREPYQNWKYDVCCQVANMEQQLAASLRQYGNPDIYDTRGNSNTPWNHQREREMEEKFRKNQLDKHRGINFGGRPYRY
ncbi:uncharacterized protein LOC106155857 [Lingula anatina]|uniref:Uncharacterized protein LOC106155857 n=1 Tax=Lingula anatina TaxID=7574 RepID=A0A1S3HJM5_LINAN|nr:uncharacterized protein LOC106155857 [Lingula anatina]|eukprot:XP_013386330.1 uncharacterized protein LOC106155857 [Lingula anatina]